MEYTFIYHFMTKSKVIKQGVLYGTIFVAIFYKYVQALKKMSEISVMRIGVTLR